MTSSPRTNRFLAFRVRDRRMVLQMELAECSLLPLLTRPKLREDLARVWDSSAYHGTVLGIADKRSRNGRRNHDMRAYADGRQLTHVILTRGRFNPLYLPHCFHRSTY